MAEVTSPIITDTTGQDIKTAINALAGAISPSVETYVMSATVTLFKFGRLVIMELKNWLTVGSLTIPERFRPSNYFYFCAEERKSDNTALGVQRFVVNIDGTCNTYDYQSTSKVIGTFMWFTN
jgi:hypothetical protein